MSNVMSIENYWNDVFILAVHTEDFHIQLCACSFFVYIYLCKYTHAGYVSNYYNL